MSGAETLTEPLASTAKRAAVSKFKASLEYQNLMHAALGKVVDRHFARMGAGVIDPRLIPPDEVSFRRWKHGRLSHEKRPDGKCEAYCARCQLDKAFPAGPQK